MIFHWGQRKTCQELSQNRARAISIGLVSESVLKTCTCHTDQCSVRLLLAKQGELCEHTSHTVMTFRLCGVHYVICDVITALAPRQRSWRPGQPCVTCQVQLDAGGDCQRTVSPGHLEPGRESWEERQTTHDVNINELKPIQNGRHFVDGIFRWIFLNEKVCILIQISQKCVYEKK